jgi:lactoylglutathione lyase
MLKTVDHMSFTVSDLDRSIEFYRGLLGCEPLTSGEEASKHAAQVIGYPQVDMRYANFPLPGGTAFLELFEYRVPGSETVPMGNAVVGNAHLGFVVDDLASEYARCAALGATFSHPEPVLVPEGTHAGAKAIYMRDPDGITIELLEFPDA